MQLKRLFICTATAHTHATAMSSLNQVDKSPATDQTAYVCSPDQLSSPHEVHVR